MSLEIKNGFFYEEGKPFFWLGDTAWLLFEKLSLDEMKQYLDDRKNKGFNVIQCVLVHTYTEAGYSCAGKDPRKKEYWDEVLAAVDYAEKINLKLAILPAWGGIVKQGILNLGNLDAYVQFLIQRFKDKKNIIWVLGGDIRGDEYYEFYDRFGKLLKAANPNRLITFHPFGRTGSYQWFSTCSWIDFHMFQSGHRRYDQIQMNTWDDKLSKEDCFGEDNYKYVRKNASIQPFKPCLDGEPSYEGILQGLHDINEPYWEAKDVRRYAYWSVLEGACGFTYGNNAIMQFHRKTDTGSYGVRETWQEALDMPGASQMKYLKDILCSVDFTKGQARPDLVIDPKSFYEHISILKGDTFLIGYSFLGKPFDLNLEEYMNKRIVANWINPENGRKEKSSEVIASTKCFFEPPFQAPEKDWVLFLQVIE